MGSCHKLLVAGAPEPAVHFTASWTGGLALVGPAARPAAAAPLKVSPHWATTGHTAADAPICSLGPGSAELGGLIDNTRVYAVVRDLLAK